MKQIDILSSRTRQVSVIGIASVLLNSIIVRTGIYFALDHG